MARVFDRNMFIMLLAIMVGAIIITYFIADIVNRSKIETLTTEHALEIETIEERNINFTDHFMKSSVLLNDAIEDMLYGDYHFDLAAKLWYPNAKYENVINNCTSAMENYLTSHQNFNTSKSFFNDTKAYTSYEKYLEILDLYLGLTGSGAKLTMLRYNASRDLKYIAENLSVATDPMNISELMELFNETLALYDNLYAEELGIYKGYKKEIDEYDFFEEIRE